MIKKFIKKLLCLFPLQKIILFESAPDFSDNTWSVFQKMLEMGINKGYKLIWILYDDDTGRIFPKYKNVYYIFGDSVICKICLCFTSVFIFCNRTLSKLRKQQLNIFLTHGIPIKDTSNYYILPEHVDAVTVPSVSSGLMIAKGMQYESKKNVVCGYPRNDVFFGERKNLKKIFGPYDKIVIWYPTFRQNRGSMKLQTNSIPLLNSEENINLLNDVAQQRGTLIVIKPHFAQDISYIKKLNLSNIRFIDDLFFVEQGITSYEMLYASDALLSDYSSVYYDYLLADRPIGLIWEDIDIYKQKPGLIDSYEYYCQAGEKIYTIHDLVKFIQDVADGKDNLKKERDYICHLMHDFNDGKNAERVVKFIMEKVGE